MRGLGHSGSDLCREGQGLGFHGARVSQLRWSVWWQRRWLVVRAEKDVVANWFCGARRRTKEKSGSGAGNSFTVVGVVDAVSGRLAVAGWCRGGVEKKGLPHSGEKKLFQLGLV